MSLLNDLIQNVGLDKSFFYQLALAIGLYFVLKKILFQPYLEKLRQREKLTQGRMDNVKSLEAHLVEQKELYEKKAKKIHKEFQSAFNAIKEKSEERFLKESLKTKEEQKKWIETKRAKLSQELREQEKALEKDLPALVRRLVEKIRS